MDLVFSKYSSPFLFLDAMIQTQRFSEFIDEFISLESERKKWEFYLHKVDGESFDEFKESIIEKEEITEEQLETTVKDSMTILMDFTPKGRG